MSRSDSSGSIVLGGIVLTAVAYWLLSEISGSLLQWLFFPLVIVAVLWAARSMGRSRGRSGGGTKHR